ncbi:MAG: phosphoesterase, partial [Acidobacteriaceae bacterium]|nr:phosphoesterase [Acidobacteriaceae bacterium]
MRTTAVGLSLLQLVVGNASALPPQEQAAQSTAAPSTRTPIKHVIVIIGENRTFDHIFATYKPKAGETVDNLLSRHIIKADGTPGTNYSEAMQYTAVDTAEDGYQNSPMSKSIYSKLPPVLVGGPTNPPFSSLQDAQAAENGLAPEYYQYLTSGGTGQNSKTVDQRIPNNGNLPAGPFQLTSATLPYDSYTASPVHRFYQMWQQLDCNAAYGTQANPSGCQADLFPWVEVTIGAGSNGKAQPANF